MSDEIERRKLSRSRSGTTRSFYVGGAEGYLTTGMFPDGGLGEIFLKVAKQGSTLGGVMDALSIAVSIGLQYGVPLRTFASKFVGHRYEPWGGTNDPEIPEAVSITDYVFARLATDFLSLEERQEFMPVEGLVLPDPRQDTSSYPRSEESG